MKAIIITIGDEILMGQILDTNSQYIARSLTDMGVEITEILSIPDKRDEIYETVEYAMSEADLIIVTGGLGPTKDDVTKKVLAEYFGSQLKMNEEVFARLEEMLKRRLYCRISAGFYVMIKVQLRECGSKKAGSH